MSRARTLPEINNVECPACESILTRSRGGGRSAEGYRLRRRVCQDCALIFTTVEVAVLYDDGSTVPLSALDDEVRWANQESQRRRIGFHGTGGGRKPYVEPARLSVHVKASRPVRRAA